MSGAAEPEYFCPILHRCPHWLDKCIQTGCQHPIAVAERNDDGVIRWRYQRKEGWGDIWRETSIDPATRGFFETPDDWNVELVEG